MLLAPLVRDSHELEMNRESTHRMPPTHLHEEKELDEFCGKR